MRRSWKKYTAEELASWPAEHKRCRMCQEVLPFSAFSKCKNTLFGLDNNCRECRKPKSKQDWQERTTEQSLLATAKFRAKKKNLQFNLELSDIIVPEVCPILGVPITTGWHAPSLDRIRPERGYTKGNVQVISKRANTLKNNMTLDELRLLSEWFESQFAS